MRRWTILVVAFACGGKPAPPPEKPVAAPTAPTVRFATPQELAKAFLDAFASADPARVHALYMTADHVHALVTCDKDPAIELRDHLAEVDHMLAAPSPAKLEYKGWIENARSVQKAGTSRDGCTAKRDFELATGSIQFTSVLPNETKPDAKLIAIVRVDDGWRVWRLSRL